MNFSTTARRTALAVLTFVCLITAYSSQGQDCSDFDAAPPSGTVTITLPLDASGDAVINNGVLNANGFIKEAGCDYYLALAPGGPYFNTPINFSCNPPPAATFGTGVGSYTLYVRTGGLPNIGDDMGPGATIVAITVNVVDNLFPTIAANAGPYSEVMDATPAGFPAGDCQYVIQPGDAMDYNPIAPAPSDNCLSFTVEYSIDGGSWTAGLSVVGQTLVGLGAHTIQWRNRDASNNITTLAPITVNITDNLPPTITCPADQLLATTDPGTCQYAYVGADATAIDNCTVSSISNNLTGTAPLAGTLFLPMPNGTAQSTVVTWTATDNSGNPVNCLQTITVTDDEPATLTCPASAPFTRYVNDIDGIPACLYPTVAGEFDAMPADNCSYDAFTYQITDQFAAVVASGSGAIPAGTNMGTSGSPYTVTWTIGDFVLPNPDNNCSFVINVEDNLPSVLSFFPFDGSGVIAFPITSGGSTSSYTSNAAGCFASVTVEQPNDIILDLSIPYLGPNYLVGDCSGTYTIIREPNAVIDGFVPPFNPLDPLNRYFTANFPVGSTVLNYTVTDGAIPANTSTISITVTVSEATPPVAICQPILLQLDANGEATLDPSDLDDGSSDNCGNVTFTASQTSFNCSHIGTTAVTLTVTDASLLTDNDVCNVTVVDNLSPALTCPLSATVAMNTPCSWMPTGIAMTQGNPTDPGHYDDNCGVLKVEYKVDGGAFTLGNDAAAGGNLSAGTHTISYRVSDALVMGNNAVCNFTIDVKDLTGPTITCPTATINPGSGCLVTATWPAPTVSDDCSLPATIVSQTHTSGSLFPYGMTTVIYTAKDAANNFSTCSFVVNVVDSQAPVVTCLPNLTVSLNIDGFGMVSTQPTNVKVNATDIITSVSDNSCFYVISPTSNTYSCANVGTPIDYIVTVADNDPASPNATCTTKIHVQDVTAPTGSCAGPTIVLNLTGTPGQAVLNAATVGTGSDNCGVTTLQIDRPSDAFTFANSITFGCADAVTLANPGLLHTVTLQVSDTDLASPNFTCTRQVQVIDNTPPVLVKPADITLTNYCDLLVNPPAVNPNPPNAGVATATDICSGVLTPSFTDAAVGAPVCPDKKIIDRTWKATDAAGNMTVATQRITLRDVTPPNMSNPPVIPVLEYLNSDVNCLKIYNLPTAGWATDLCGNQFIAYTYSIDYPPFGSPDISGPISSGSTALFFKIGQNQFTLTATDACNLTTSTTLNVTVLDKAVPTINEPFSQTLGNTDNVCNQTFTINNANNNCGNTFTWFRPYVNGAGIADDDFTDCSTFLANGNGGVTEAFTTPPGQGSISVPPFNYNSSANAHPTAFFPVGNTVVTYTATDVAGNSTVCAFTVKVLDIQPPQITCPADQILSTICPGDPFPPYLNQVNILDNCNAVVQKTQSPAPGVTLESLFGMNPMPGDVQVVTMTATDAFANNLSSTCTFTVTLADGSAPVPTVPGQLPTIESFCGSVIIDAPTATDNDPGCNPIPNIIFGTPSSPVGMLIPGSNPPQYNFIYTPAFGNPSNYVVTWIYNDGNGNQSSQLQNIIVWKDDFPPVAKCKDIIVDLSTPLNGTANVSITPAMVDNGSNDNGPMGCMHSVNLVSVTPNGFGCANIGPNTVTLTVTDDAVPANAATCTAIVTVRDLTTPVLNGVPANITLESCRDAIPAPAAVTSSDNCTAPVVFTETSTQTGAGCSKYTYTITRSWIATDGGGNIAAAGQTITVKDTKPPMFSPSIVDVTVATEAADADCDAVVSLNITSGVTDSCAASNEIIISQAYSGPGRILNSGCSGGCADGVYEKGIHTLTFTASDNCGNVAVKVVTVTVTDATIPTAVCINGVSAALQVSGMVVLNTNQFNNNSYDNCPGVLDLKIQRLDLLPLQPPSNTLTFTCVEADGVTHRPVKLFVTDAAGNMSMCLTYVVIQDNNAPSITCPVNVTVACTDDYTATVQGAGVPTVTDNCPANILPQAAPVDVITDGVGATCQLVTRTWTAEDIAHNTSTCVQTISIVDNVLPTFSSLPGNATITCSDPLIDWPVLTATDNCGTAVTIDQDTVTTQTSLGCGKYSYVETRTWTATDACGNKSTHTQVVTVTDLVAPQYIGSPDTLTVLSSNQPLSNNCTVPVNFDIRDYLFECADSADITVVNTITPAVSGIGTGSNISGAFPVGEYEIAFKATDACGNMSLDTMLLIVVDNSVPTMVCNNNVVIALGTNGEGTIDANDIDLGSTDNCDIDTLVLSQSIFDCSDLGVNTIQLTATDIYGNSNFCSVNVNVTLGTNSGFNLVATGSPETFFGAADGAATVVATGGTGTFDYEWSNSETTASVTGLAAGTYTVTVFDTGSGCVAVDTVVVQAGPKVTINVGTGDGCQGETVTIAVTADNFINVSGFSLGLMLSNAAAGTITSLSDVNPALVGLVPGVNSVFWTHPTLTPTTLPNGTLLFNVNIQLSNAAQGTNSAIAASALPALVFLQNGTIQAPMVNFNNGSVTISCVVGNLELLGDITTWKVPVKPVPGVNVALTGTNTGNDLTALPPADYQFFVSSGANTVVTPSKSEAAKNNKINVGDLLLIQAHAAPPPVQIPFTSPYQWIAADINGSGTINLVDYALVQAYIINNMPSNGHFAGNPTPPDWKFVPKAYIFPAPNPLAPAPPSTIEHNNVVVPFLDDDFIAILMGDVNGDVVPSITGGGTETSGSAFKFRLDERALEAGETVVVPFKAADFNKRQAYQLTVAFDPEVMQLEGITPGVLPGLSDANFGTSNAGEGMLSTLWVGSTPLTLADNETLFSLTFKVMENATALSSVIRPSSDVTEALAIDKFGDLIPVEFEFASSVATGEVLGQTFALYQNQPNPFAAETSIAFRLPETGRATLRVLSAEGRLVKMIVGEFAEGVNTIKLNKAELGSNGVYYYELETAKHSDRKKMILID